MLLFVVVPAKSPPRRNQGRGWWWALWLALGLIVVSHGCHSGDHDIDDEPGVVHSQREQNE